MAGALAYRDDYRYEMIHGKEIIMSPISFQHYIIQKNLFRILDKYLCDKPNYELLLDFAVYFDKNHWMEPDICIVSDRTQIKKASIDGAPDFVVEIFSVGTYKRDIGVKKDTYEQYGVKEYWTIDPANKSVTVYLNKDGKFTVDNVYYKYDEEDLEMAEAKRKGEIEENIKLSMFDDLIISVDDIFNGI